jgi:hypothetical protein
MKTQIETEALLQAIERRLGEISERQHALAVERTHLLEQATPLRLGVASPETAVVQLRSKGITLRGLVSAPPASRRPPRVVLRAVVSPRPRMVSLPPPHSETA